MGFSTILFDLDGTLVDTSRLIVASFQHTFRETLGIEVSEAEIHRHWGEPLPMTMEAYAPDRVEELVAFYRTYNRANHDRLVTGFDGMQEAIRSLHEGGVQLAVVTSKLSEMARRGLKVAGLLPYFDTVVGVEHTTVHKPDPTPLYLALDLLGEKPGDHVLMVGDTTMDITSGKNAGIKTAVVGWSELDRAELAVAEPHYWLAHPADLVTLALS